MSKLRRNNLCSSPRNGNKNCNDGINEQSSNAKLKLNKSKLISHDDFLNRIQKSLYYGGTKAKMSIPLSDYIADTFSDTHHGYSLNRLNYTTVGNLRSTPCSLILAMIYLDRLKDADPAYTKHVTPTELFLVSMMVATKFYSGHDEEAPYVNWAECMNMTPDSLLQMELTFLSALDWKVYVSNGEFFDKVKSLEQTLARRQGTHRGWYTYTELNSLLPSIQIAKQFLQSTLIFGLSYTAFVATMVASVFLVSQIPGTYLNTSSQTTTSQSAIATNNRTHNQTDVNDTPAMLSTTSDNTLIDTNFDSNNLLDLTLNRLNEFPDRGNAKNQSEWDPLSLYSWYSMLERNAFKWSVISNNFIGNSQNDITPDFNRFASDLFCNLTSPTSIFTLQPNTERIKIDFNGIKMKFA